VVLAHSSLRPLAPRTVLEVMIGSDDPAQVLGREAERQLRQRGYQTVLTTAQPGRTAEEWPAAIAEAGADAALLVNLQQLDTTALQVLGRAEVALNTQLLASSGQVLWAQDFRGETSVQTYRSEQDWRTHLREALRRAMRGLP
jgi:hypothetical protein